MIFTKFLLHVAYGRDPILLRRHCNMLCTSGFVDDVIVLYDGLYSGTNFATKDRFHLNLLLYHKVRQNLT